MIFPSSVVQVAFEKILAERKPNELMKNLGKMIPALNITELVYLIEKDRANAASEIVQEFLRLAEQLLKPEEWKLLSEQLSE